ncbi:MAG: hypothetical protein R3218_04755 [Christiangramia sp.]|nr:hypothetical protein [Christiangramia sp.]
MRVFKEEQAFRQWWLFLISGSTLLASAIPFLNFTEGFQYNTGKFIAFILVALIIIFFWIVRLRTKINSTGIYANFTPLKIFKKHYKWSEIEDCYVRKYSPITEYGGWGIRGLGEAKAYNVSGDTGIQIITKNHEKFLIGTKKPEQAKKIIERYKDKFKQK